jgi:hypothetical protein
MIQQRYSQFQPHFRSESNVKSEAGRAHLGAACKLYRFGVVAVGARRVGGQSGCA